jgi:hypothetical protein
MKPIRLAFILSVLLEASSTLVMADSAALDPHLEPLRPLLKKT